jgi:putative oxidoreductase
MNLVHKIEDWGDHHHPMVLDVVRIALGVFLLLKGLAFMENSAYLEDMIASQNVAVISPGLLMVLVYYVTFAHLVGGALIAMGTLTRFACIIQIPIVLAAVFLTDFFQSPINTLALPSIVALALLVLFTIIGSGPLSLDRFLSNWSSEG